MPHSSLYFPHDLLAFDREHVWHPYTSMTDPTPVRLVNGADGTRIFLADGSQLIDAMSSWWAAIHGYGHPDLTNAAQEQLEDFPHVMFGGLTHRPAIHLAEKLVAITPEGLDHVFLADSGSVSVEVALKMVLQHQRGVGRPERTRMLTIRGGYHGDTFGCMSVCDPVGGMHSMFSEVLPAQVFADRPPAALEDVPAWADGFRALAAAHAHELAGIIVEPLLQGAGGMHVYPAECLRVMREVADEHGLVLVFDEIATGFGRTGWLFAADAAGVTPDVMCVGKALTGGYLTLAAVLCTGEVARGLSASESGVLMHGPTYMGNPLACAVALANLRLLETGEWRSDVERIHAGLTTGLAPLRDAVGVLDVRTIGAVGVVQLDHPVDVVKATDAAAEEGVWLRPFRDLLYTMPPYVATDDEVARICTAIARAVEVA
jgi:adenosylmethionine-8-amino-7-oxononanoate aminotransferase